MEEIYSSEEYEQVEKLRKELNVSLEDLFPFVFSLHETFEDNVEYYLQHISNIPILSLNII